MVAIIALVGILPQVAFASIVQGANAGTDSHAVDFSKYGSVCFDVPATISVKGITVGLTKSDGSFTPYRLINNDTNSIIWAFGAHDDIATTTTENSVSTSTTSFTLTPARYCVNMASNTGNEYFHGLASDGGAVSQAYGASLAELIGNDAGSPVTYFGSVNYSLCDTAGVCPLGSPSVDTTSRIVSFTPEDGATTTSPVTFTSHFYVSPADVGTVGMYISLHNIDQNVLLFGLLSPNDIVLFSGYATTTGDVYYSTTTPIGDGNYRIQAKLFNAINNPLGGELNLGVLWGINKSESHQFIVGQETYIGHISQQSYRELSQAYASTSATSTIANASNCNPLGSFDTIKCVSFLLIPDANSVAESVAYFKDNTLNHAPWGYFKRVNDIMSATSTVDFPSWTVHPAYYQDPDFYMSVNPTDMIAGGGALLDAIHDPIYGKNWRDVFTPIIQLIIGLITVVIIFFDIMHGQQSVNGGRGFNNRDL